VSPESARKILIVRRDNIGDLVCTTPLITALRSRLPDAWIGVLANSYNAPVLAGNPDIDEVFVYTKAKHRTADEFLPAILWRRLRMMRRLRAMKLTDVVLANPAFQPRLLAQARWLTPRRIVGFGSPDRLDVALSADNEGRHEVEDVFRLGTAFGIGGTPPPCRVVGPATPHSPMLTVGIHVSARKPSQRWSAARFAETIVALAAREPMRFLLLWSPGPADNQMHPGDDEKAHEILQRVGDRATVVARPTHRLAELIAALAECDALICADGGAMHLAAGLGRPIVCLFGNSGAARWQPWGVPYRLLQKPSLDVSEIGVNEVVDAFSALRDGIRAPSA